jgi:peptide/nickel transport system permease protein
MPAVAAAARTPAQTEPVAARPTFWTRARRHPGFLLGLFLLLAIGLMAVLAPWLAPHDPYAQDLSRRLIPPFWHDGANSLYPLGTDHLGRDYLSRVMYGARISLMIGFIAALVSGIVGVGLGLAAGYFGGRVDLIVTFLITVRLSMPLVVVALAVVAQIGGSLTVLMLVIGFLIWDRYAVVVRSAAKQIRSQDYIVAAQTVGSSSLRILWSEMLPNLSNAIIVIATLEMAHAILVEAAMSFLGLGVQPPLPSWGLMISEGKNSILFDPWVIAVPGTALFVLVLAINLFGDGLRDITAPENRN